jgi:hypothetical protein
MKNKVFLLLVSTAIIIITNTSCSGSVNNVVDDISDGATHTPAIDSHQQSSVDKVVDNILNGATETPFADEVPTLLPDSIRFEGAKENILEFPYKVIPLNNCAGTSEVEQTVTNIFTHEIVDETKEKLGVELPFSVWLNIVANIEHKYGITITEQEIISSKLKAMAGENVEYTLVHRQTWESGTVITKNKDGATTAAYRILENETIGIAKSERKPCP